MIKKTSPLIVALDLPTVSDAKEMVSLLGKTVSFYKVGLELLMAEGGFSLLSWLRSQEKHIFADFKFYDIPRTVAAAIDNLAKHHITMTTLHADPHVIKEAAMKKGDMKILAVTVLTSMEKEDLLAIGVEKNVKETVMLRARHAFDAGADGVVCSGLEAYSIRQLLGNCATIVTPGIRLKSMDDDQKRIVTPQDAIKNGASHIVVGRPILMADDPKQSAENILDSIKD